MILGFKQYFPWHTKDKPAPTYFREKILSVVGLAPWEADGKKYLLDVNLYNAEARFKGEESNLTTGYPPKPHTIREGSRWKAGDIMHMAYGVRTKNYQQFNKYIPELERVKSVQQIEIVYGKEFGAFQAVIVAVDHKVLNERERKLLAVNDGFESLDKFYQWFGKDFTGQIIHFTDLKY